LGEQAIPEAAVIDRGFVDGVPVGSLVAEQMKARARQGAISDPITVFCLTQ
jgi:hypothetical protein